MSATSVMVSSSSSTAATFAVAWSMMARAWLFRPEVLWSVMAMLLWLFVRRHQVVSLRKRWASGDHRVAFFIGCSSRPRRIAIGYLLQALEPGLCGQRPGSRCRIVMPLGLDELVQLGRDSADRWSTRMCSFFLCVQLF